jgi:hypothetical protein
MNDYMEVKHGVKMLEDAFSDNGTRKLGCMLRRLLNVLIEVDPDIEKNTLINFQKHKETVIHQSFAASLTIHENTENKYGRLSMWRGYNHEKTGVALIFKKAAFVQDGSKIGVISGPVSYLTEENLEIKLCETILKLKKIRTS